MQEEEENSVSTERAGEDEDMVLETMDSIDLQLLAVGLFH